jgi:hypothetical protein
MKRYTHRITDEGGLLVIEYELLIEYDIQPAEPENNIPCAGLVDVIVTKARCKIGGREFPIDTHPFNFLLEHAKSFKDDIESAISEHEHEQHEAALEFYADAKWQARRDGE